MPMSSTAPGIASRGAVDYDVRYRKGWAYGKEPNEFLATTASVHLSAAPCEILSLGEGQGRNVAHLASLGHWCTAVDSSAVGLAKAKALASNLGVRPRIATVQMDLCCYCPFQRSGTKESVVGPRAPLWDAVISIFCALPPAERRRLHRDCLAALRPGGLVIIECFAPRHAESLTNSGGRSWARSGPAEELLVSTDDLLEDFGGGLDVVLCREVSRQLDEGSYHRGMATLTQFVGRRPQLPPSPPRAPPPPSSESTVRKLGLRPSCYRETMDALFALRCMDDGTRCGRGYEGDETGDGTATDRRSGDSNGDGNGDDGDGDGDGVGDGDDGSGDGSGDGSFGSARRALQLAHAAAASAIASAAALKEAAAAAEVEEVAAGVAAKGEVSCDPLRSQTAVGRANTPMAHDRLLACAQTSIAIAVESAVQQRVCRLCWVRPQP